MQKNISKESIFTGLNNFNVMSITDVEFDEYFGFTDEEVRKRGMRKNSGRKEWSIYGNTGLPAIRKDVR